LDLAVLLAVGQHVVNALVGIAANFTERDVTVAVQVGVAAQAFIHGLSESAELTHRGAGLARHAADHQDDAAALRIALVELIASVDAELSGEARIDDDEHLLALSGEAVGAAEQRGIADAPVIADEGPSAVLIAAVAAEEDDDVVAGLAR